MKILIVAATEGEVGPLKEWLQQNTSLGQDNSYQLGLLQIELLITGVGMMQTAFQLGRQLEKDSYELVINAGVAGTYNPNLAIGSVVHVTSEKLADLGAELASGQFVDASELGILDPGQFPFNNGTLVNPMAKDYDFLPKVSGLSVNKVSGCNTTIMANRQRYAADVESMEGAAVFYACLSAQLPFLEIRAISNLVEPRNKENWDLPLAIKNLNQTLESILETLNE